MRRGRQVFGSSSSGKGGIKVRMAVLGTLHLTGSLDGGDGQAPEGANRSKAGIDRAVFGFLI